MRNGFLKIKNLALASFIISFFLISAIVLPAQANIVDEIQLKGLVGIDESVVRNVIPFNKGDEFSIEKLDQAVQYLRQWGIFDKIEASPIETERGVVVEMRFVMATVITQIDIYGNYPNLENQILKYMTIHTGDIYTEKRAEEQVEIIRNFYKKAGYIKTEVSFKKNDQPAKQGVSLIFYIKHGDVLRYRDIQVKGNKAFPNSRFASALNTWKAYSEKRLRNSIRDLTDVYRHKGYPKIKIKVTDLKIDYDTGRVDLTIDVDEGPFVNVKFSGNREISERKLKKTITVFDEGSFDSYELDTSVEKIKTLYKERGYPSAIVKVKKTVKENEDVEINFDIKEGKSRIVKKVNFKGNKHIGSNRLRKTIDTTQRSIGFRRGFDKEIVSDDNGSIKKEYSKDGFLNTEVGEWDVNTSDQGFDLIIDIPITEGPQVIVKEVVFNGNKAFDKKRLMKGLKVVPNKPLNQEDLPNEVQRLLSFYANNGYPYAKVEQKVIQDLENNRIDIFYDIDEGHLVTIGSILIVGDILSSQKAIKGAMGISEGEPYSYKKIVESRLNLRRLGAYSSVKVDPVGLEEKENKVHLKVEVNEQRSFLLDFGFGYSEYQKFTGFVSFKNLNSFGWAKHTLFKLTGGRDLSRVELGWLDPRFLGSSFEMSVNAWLQHANRPAFNYIQAAGSAGFFRRYRSFGFLFRYELDRNYFIEGNTTAADQESLRNNTISKITLSASYDNRDSFANPKKGFFTLGQVDIFNEIKGNQANFAKFTWNGENDQSFWKIFTITTGLRFSRIQGIGNRVSVPTNELLFLGGDDTVRGYGEDSLGPVNAQGKPVGGRIRWIWNEELRIRVWNQFYWVFFVDVGSLTNYFSDVTWYNTRKSTGFGLRYITPVGPIRVDYGIKLDRRTGESFGSTHLTFGFVF
ncbi:MAG: outer membrane protein assembly factor BamA [Deltaproteobacteria bacterium CG07_land_8_20_14_0_80_38_7]|nr:MAG: outer membrane protein assembly factor BamA [Deltaproteobacteria bacterium CG07_land_8_20_14_0_80_38_7]